MDSPDRLEWRDWVPGTEYIKQLVVKNVSTNTVKVKYKQTASKAFSMDFPEPIKLRPGMSVPLKVCGRGSHARRNIFHRLFQVKVAMVISSPIHFAFGCCGYRLSSGQSRCSSTPTILRSL